MKHYKGKGEHSVNELEEMCAKYAEIICKPTNQNIERYQTVHLNSMGYPIGIPVDEHGNPVSRTKSEYPNSYDAFVTWRMESDKRATGTVYSDRLYEWDIAKYNLLSEKYFGNEGHYWDARLPKDIESFLKDYFEAPNLKLLLIMEYCNVSSGYPVWRFDYSAV